MSLFFAQTQLGLLTSFLQMFAGLALGLSWMLVAYDRGGSARDTDAFRFWLRIFALTVYSTFALGLITMVQTGLVLPQALVQMGNVLGPLLLVVVLIAFVTKSTVFAAVLYSRHRVTAFVYRVSLVLTAIGASVVVGGLAVIDSWMRAPAGAILLDGQFRIHDWFEVMGNPQISFQLWFVLLTAVLMLSSVMVCAFALQTRIGAVDEGSFKWARLLTVLGLLATLAVLPMAHHVFDKMFAEPVNLKGILMGQHTNTPSQVAAMYCARFLLLFWVTHFVVLIVALFQVFQSPSENPLLSTRRVKANQVMVLAAWTGPLISLALWWLIDLSKGPEMVVGALMVEDLMTNVPMQYLFLGVLVSSVVVILVFYGWFRLAYQALSEGVTTVHRPGVVLS